MFLPSLSGDLNLRSLGIKTTEYNDTTPRSNAVSKRHHQQHRQKNKSTLISDQGQNAQ
jgi:hypothetical protein